MPELTITTCPPKCSAGGDEKHGGHVFDQSVNFYKCADCGEEWGVRGEINSQNDADREQRSVAIAHAGETGCRIYRHGHVQRYYVWCCGGSMACRCGMSEMDFDLARLP